MHDENEIFMLRARHCKRCGKALTSAAAVLDGYGHVCKQRMREEELAKRQLEGQIDLFGICD